MKAFRILNSALMLCIIGAVLAVAASTAHAGSNPSRKDQMSAMGKRAATTMARIKTQKTTTFSAHAAVADDDDYLNKAECREGKGGRPPGS